MLFANNAKLVLKIIVLFAFLFYFVFHAIIGDNGFISYMIVQKKISEQAEQLGKMQKERGYLQHHVELLNSKTLDLDLLEERCRVILNYAYADDVVVRAKTVE